MEHEGVFFEVGSVGGALMGAFIWRTNRGQGCGGIRSREYPSAREWLRDGLRLATGMGRKNALAGLFWGGAKGVVAQPPPSEFPLTPQARDAIFTDYGRFLTSLRGCYVAAEDSGAFPLEPPCGCVALMLLRRRHRQGCRRRVHQNKAHNLHLTQPRRQRQSLGHNRPRHCVCHSGA
jgi:hypothetical protein